MTKRSILLNTASAAALITASALSMTTGALAQDGEEFVLDEIMVTASRRGDTGLLETPVAITAMDTKMIEKYSPRDLNDMAAMVPSLSSGTVSAFKSASFAMRGVSETTIIVYKESPVGVTLDDFVLPSIQTSNLEMFDIEQIEVLRGPQGTLFGKNTTGGVINVRTKRPDLVDGEIDARYEYGSFGTNKATVAINIPIQEDKLGFRFAGMYLKSDGYMKNGYVEDPRVLGLPRVKGDGRDLGGDDVFSGRAKLLWKPTDTSNVLIQYEHINDNGETPALVNESGPGYVFDYWGWGEGSQEDPLDRAGVTTRDDAVFDMDDGHKVDVDGFYLNTDFAINDDLTFYSVTGYRKQESRLVNNYSGTVGGVSLFDATRDDDRKTFQHEMRIASDGDGPFNWVGGVFYQKNDVKFCVTQYVGFLDFFGLGTPPGFFNTNPLILCNTQDASAIAGFVDGTYDVSDKLHITAGVRYTEEKKTWMGRPRVNFFALEGAPDPYAMDEFIEAADFDKYPAGVVTDSQKWTEPTYRLNLAYDISDDAMVYAGYTRGFKSGGYNDQLGTSLNPIPAIAARPTNPETADSFEAGFKSSFMDNKASMSLTAYHVTYNDAQRTFNVTVPSGGQTTLFFNAAKMRVKGIEFEASIKATDALMFRTAGSYMDANYISFEADTNYDGVVDVDLSGQTPTRSPKWKVGGDVNYNVNMAGGSIDFNTRLTYESSSIAGYSDVASEYDTTLNAKTLVDASITYRDDDDRYHVRLVGRNLTNKRYRTGTLSVATLWIMSAYAPPRYFGIEIGTKFGL